MKILSVCLPFSFGLTYACVLILSFWNSMKVRVIDGGLIDYFIHIFRFFSLILCLFLPLISFNLVITSSCIRLQCFEIFFFDVILLSFRSYLNFFKFYASSFLIHGTIHSPWRWFFLRPMQSILLRSKAYARFSILVKFSSIFWSSARIFSFNLTMSSSNL